MAVAVTQASTTGAKRRTSKSASTISSAKSDPASGAWNDAAIPAPAPAASRIEVSLRGNSRNRLSDDATAPPRCTTGPSRPALPPEPITRPAASDFQSATRPLIGVRWCTASITSTTPWPPLSGLTWRTSSAARSAPSAGPITQIQRGACARSS